MLTPSNYPLAQFIFWLPGLCVALHIFEEFVWPGKFLAWYRVYRPEIAASITPRFAVSANALLVAAVVVLGFMGPAWSRGMSLWLTLAALLAANAVFHFWGALRTHRYSPGVATGVLLYVPLCVWGFWHFLQNQDATLELAVISLLIGGSYQFWSTQIHRGLLIRRHS